MEIKLDENDSQGRFFVGDKDKPIALLNYFYKTDNVLVITHTEVDSSLQGQGVGKALIEAVVNFAKQNDLKIQPLCTYASAVLIKNEVYKSILI